MRLEPLEDRRLLSLLALQDKLLSQEVPQGGDSFGRAVAVEGDTLVVGSPNHDGAGPETGAAYVFVRDDQGTPGDESDDRWAFEAALTAGDAAGGDWFGCSVSISGSTVVVGAYGDNDGGSNSGSAYVFTRTGGVWSEQQKLTAGDAAGFDYFGRSVSISGDSVVVGAYYDDDGGGESGSAYVFTRNNEGVWSQKRKLTASDAAPQDNFGYSVSISGDTVVVGANRDDDGGTDSGSAYVFTRTDGVWSQRQKLTAGDAAGGEWFGCAVSISGDTVVVGAYRDDDRGSESGSAYFFTRTGSVWSEQQKLTASDAAGGDQFGASVSISGDTLVVGALLNDATDSDSGSAYVFARTSGVWSEQQKLVAADGAASDHFGGSVSVSGDTVVVGADDDNDDSRDSGSAYAFGRSGETWWERPKIHIPRQDPNRFDFFGRSVAVDGDYMVVGATGRDGNCGAAYVFRRDDNHTPGNQWDDHWVFEATLTAVDGEAGDRFGHSVCISGDTVVVGAFTDDIGTLIDAGSVYVFTRVGYAWIQQAKLTADDAGADDVFGSSVSISGDWVVVGAPGYNAAVDNVGKVYGFQRSGDTWTCLWSRDGSGAGRFGESVSISGDTLVVGDPQDDDHGGTDCGSAYVFTRTDDGVWSRRQHLTAGDAASGDHFGYAVSISGHTIVVGAPSDDDHGAYSGSAYIFAGPAGGMFERQKLTASDGAPEERFGQSVSISSDTVVVGGHGEFSDASHGRAFVFSYTGDAWRKQQTLTAFDGEDQDRFGCSVSISGETVVVGAAYDDDGESKSGSAYVFGPAHTGSLPYSVPAGTGGSDLTLRRNGPYLEVYDEVASQVVAADRVVMTQSVEITGADGQDDRLTADFPFGGHFAPVDGIRFDGGAGANDSLRILGTGTTAGSYLPSGTTGSGAVNLDGPAGTTTIQFTGLEPLEVSAMSQFVLTTPNVRDNVTLAPGTGSGGEPAGTIAGSSGGVPFESLTFFDVTDFEIDLASPGQTVFDSDSLAFTGTPMARNLERLTISSGDGADTFDVGSAEITLPDGFCISAADGRLTLAGGTIDADNLDFVGGELSGYGTVDAAIVGLARIEADGGALHLGDGSYGAFHHDGELEVGAETVTLNTAGLAELGTVTSISGGTLVAPGGVVLGVGDNLVGQGTVAARVAAAFGSTIRATGDLELGDAASFAGFFSDGELYVGNHTVAIYDQDVGMLGSLTEIGNSAGNGALFAPNGLLLEAGKTAFGYGLVGGDFVNQGHVIGGGPQPDDGLEFTGDVSGSGSFDGEIKFSGTYSPGNSPAEVDFLRNVTFAPTARLEIELGGTLPGEFDALDIAGQAQLGGELVVSLIDDYVPGAGDVFEIVGTGGGLLGTFATESLPALPPDHVWKVDCSPHAMTLQVELPSTTHMQAVLRAADTGLPANPNGEADTLPESLQWVDEWDSFWIEIWGRTPDTTGYGIGSFSVDLVYNTDLFTATTIQYGPAFTEDRSGTIDDAAGRVDNIGAATLRTDVGDDQNVLLARVFFEPMAGDAGCPHNADGQYITPVEDLGLAFEEAGVELVGIGQSPVQLGASPETDSWPVIYDVDDDGQVGFGDLAFFATAFQQNVGDPGADFAWACDFDHSLKVDVGDLAFFAENFQRTPGSPMVYPGNFPADWQPDTEGAALGKLAAGENLQAADRQSLNDSALESFACCLLDFATAQAASSHTTDTKDAANGVDLLLAQGYWDY